MFSLLKKGEVAARAFSIAFSRPTFHRAPDLLIGAILIRLRRTITNIQCAVVDLLNGHFSTLHRDLNRANLSQTHSNVTESQRGGMAAEVNCLDYNGCLRVVPKCAGPARA